MSPLDSLINPVHLNTDCDLPGSLVINPVQQ